MPVDYANKIRAAAVYDVARKTPLDSAPLMSARLDNEVLLKREDLQSVFSFKLRGAYNKIAGLSDAEQQRGVLAASAGNHAQGVALSAQRLGIRAQIVMPKTTPDIKVDSVRRMGAEVVLHGNTYDDACAHALSIADSTGMVFVHAYDDPDVIAGQATVGVEILEQSARTPDAVFVPVGGGGLIAGIATWIKAQSPSTRIIGIEPDDAPCMYEALRAGERVEIAQVGLFADGVAVNKAGAEPFRLASLYVDEMLLVSTDEICAAIKDTFDELRTIPEPAGALALAGMKKWVAREQVGDQCLIAVVSGANVNFDRLRHIAERAEIGEQREALLAATIPEKPGSFRAFCHAIGARSITEFNYRYADAGAKSGQAHVFVGVQLRHGAEEKLTLMETLQTQGYQVADLTDNEMAKLHIRYMVGGHASGAQDELLYRFQFPERPGALLHFLTSIGEGWNISLFHYRNHGAAYARVLVGIQVPQAERPEFRASLDQLGLQYWDETDNPSYSIFLS